MKKAAIQDDMCLNSMQHYLIREAPMSYDKLMHQVDIRIAVFKQALWEHLNRKYK